MELEHPLAGSLRAALTVLGRSTDEIADAAAGLTTPNRAPYFTRRGHDELDLNTDKVAHSIYWLCRFQPTTTSHYDNELRDFNKVVSELPSEQAALIRLALFT